MNKKNILIGLTVIVGIVLLYWGISFLKGVNLFKPANFFYAHVDKVDGLTVSTPVNVNGFQVGQIRDITYDYANNKITLELSMNKDMQIPEGSTIAVNNGLLGSSELKLTLGQSSQMMKVGSYIPVEVPVGLMDVVNKDVMPQVTGMLPKVDSIVGNVNQLVGNPALRASVTRLDAITAQLARSAQELEQLMRQLNASVPPVVNQAGQVMTNANGVMVNAKGLTNDLKTTTSNLNTFTGTLNDTTLQRINTTLANLQTLSAQLNDPKSSLGMLMHDKQLYQNAAGSLSALQALIEDIKAHPKKYITVKVF